jgi:hypothetical protein
MASPFDVAIQKMADLGLFKFLFPFMLTSAIFYGLLRKSQIFGNPDQNVAVNAIVALVAGFMVWSYPIIAGIDITLQLANFFMEGLIVSLVIMVGLLIAGFVFPTDLPKHLAERMGGASRMAVLVLGFILGAVILVSSGLFGIFFPTTGFGVGMIDQDTLLTIGILIILLVSIIIIVGVGGGKSTPAPAPKGEKE